MRENQSFSREVSREVAGIVQNRVRYLTSTECIEALNDLAKITMTKQWNFTEYALKPILQDLIQKRLMSLN